MQHLILNIPHSSTTIPDKDGFIVDDIELEKEQIILTDWYTDDLFKNPFDISIQAEFSRIFCDVERFVDDKKEIMAQFGMGVLYETKDDGTPMRKITPGLRSKIIENYYIKHHQELTNAVHTQLELNGSAVIIDCHSFPDKPLKRDLNHQPDRPDINIGTDPYHTPTTLVEIANSFCSDHGFSLGIDWPYKGTIVPSEYYRANPDVLSVMIEINRKLYLKEGTTDRLADYAIIKSKISEFLTRIRNGM
jgi:N-formylglutamate deformylase